MSFKGFLTRLTEPLTGMWSAPGSPLRLKKPPGFEPTDAFPGLIEPASSGSIMVQTLPAPYAEIAAGFTRDALVARGLAPRSDEAVAIDGRPARLVGASQEAAGRTFDKWLLLVDAGGEAGGQTALVMATWDAEAAATGEALRHTLLEARFAPDAGPAALGAGVTLGATDKLRYATAWGGMSIYTPDGAFTPGKPGAALFLAGHGLRDVASDRQQAFATEHVGQLDADLAGVSVTAQRPVAIGDLTGWETQAVGVSQKDGRRMVLWETLLFDAGRYVVLTGFVNEDLAATYVPAFQDLAAGFKP